MGPIIDIRAIDGNQQGANRTIRTRTWGLQDNMQQMEIGVADKLQQLEMTLARVSDVLLTGRDSPSHHNFGREGSSRTLREGGDYNKPFSSKIAKLDFPRFSGDELMEWLNRVNQFFDF